MSTTARADASLRQDVIGGITTFVTMSYIVIVNPSITRRILRGFLLHAIRHAVVGRGRKVGGMLWILAAISAALLVLQT